MFLFQQIPERVISTQILMNLIYRYQKQITVQWKQFHLDFIYVVILGSTNARKFNLRDSLCGTDTTIKL